MGGKFGAEEFVSGWGREGVQYEVGCVIGLAPEWVLGYREKGLGLDVNDGDEIAM